VVGALALGVTLVVNVDALLILQHLNTQPGLRDAIVAQAKTFTESNAGGLKVDAGGADKKATAPDKSPDSLADVIGRAHAVEQELTKLSLPIGWYRAGDATKDELARFRKDNFLVIPADANGLGQTVLFHLFGWLLTAIAASLGAPFWFDTLNKFMSVRAAGKAPEEKPKAPKEVPTPLEPGQTPREADRVAWR
jgi:hypothetical protein